MVHVPGWRFCSLVQGSVGAKHDGTVLEYIVGSTAGERAKKQHKLAASVLDQNASVIHYGQGWRWMQVVCVWEVIEPREGRMSM